MARTLTIAILMSSVVACDPSAEALDPVLAPARLAIDRAHRQAPALRSTASPDAVPRGDIVQTRPRARGETTATPPDGYVVMEPRSRSGDFGHAVVLQHPSDDLMIPIFIGGTEALSIQLRLENKLFKRPLTHDLFDNMVAQIGGKVLRAQVNALEEGVFMGSVVLDAGGRVIELDARPSDAIALAVGNQVPIYVAHEVVREAGVRSKDPASTKHPEPPPSPVQL